MGLYVGETTTLIRFFLKRSKVSTEGTECAPSDHGSKTQNEMRLELGQTYHVCVIWRGWGFA